MSAPTTLYEQLVRDEGKKASAYPDSRGFWTIASGVCIDARRGCGLTDDEQQLLTMNRIAIASVALSRELPWTDALDFVRRDALLNMTYQLGITGLVEFRQALAALQRGDYAAAARMFLESKWHEETPARAQRMALQIETGERQ